MLIKCRALTIAFFFAFVTVIGADIFQKLRICVVDGKGGFQKSNNFCPTLANKGPITCVKAFDRFDCLRKIRKGFADFSIFAPEDLVAAMNTDNDILITNELRITEEEEYEEEVVAVVRKTSGITTSYDLSEKVLCHPGYGSVGFVSEVLANFLEMTVVRPQSCETTLTVPENRIRSSSQFFKSSCKPGPWVNDVDVDRELKGKYRNLCKACGSPASCSEEDKYYGSSGSLQCLKDGAGDVSWTTRGQVQSHFNFNSNNTEELSSYGYLCRDNDMRPLNTTKPCVWVAKPWSVIAASRQTAAAVQTIVSNITHTKDWQGTLLDLLEVVSYHVVIHTLDGVEAVDTYLSRIPGYLNANSFTGCQPPRTVKICTTSIPAQYKCTWMREAAAVQGIEPDIDCLKADNETHCMEAIQNKVAHVVIVHPDYLNVAKNKYNLKTLFYETVENEDKYLTVAVIKRDSNIKSLEDMRGRKACFPSYDGVSWNTIQHILYTKGILEGCPFDKAMENFFGESCVPDMPSGSSEKLRKLCRNDQFRGDIGALTCLKEGGGDVAFVSQNNFRKFVLDKNNINLDFRVFCDKKPCHLSWAPPAQALVAKNITIWRDKDILDVFLELDNLFGSNFKEATPMFSMYGEFDGKNDILFNDKTVQLRKFPSVKDYDVMPRFYEDILHQTKICADNSSSLRNVPSILGIFIFTIVISCFRMYNF